VLSGLIGQVRAAISGLLLRYAARASVAVPFVIALGFAVAAVTMMLVERFGQVRGYWIMAGGLVVIGVVAAIAVAVKEHEEETAEQRAEAADTGSVVSEAAGQAMIQAPMALLSGLFAVPGGAASAMKVARVLGRNFPLVLLLVLIGALFWPTAEGAGEEGPRARGDGKADAPSPLLHS
jgi:hypothetical protein